MSEDNCDLGRCWLGFADVACLCAPELVIVSDYGGAMATTLGHVIVHRFFLCTNYG